MDEIEFLTIDSSGSDISALNIDSGDEVVVPPVGFSVLWNACETWNDDDLEDGTSFVAEIDSRNWEKLVSINWDDFSSEYGAIA